MHIERMSEQIGRRVVVDGVALLGERCALTGLNRRGAVSCGGGTRLMRARDHWMALSLVRDDDFDSLEAWLEVDSLPTDRAERWNQVQSLVARRGAEELVGRATLLSLAAAVLGECVDQTPAVLRVPRPNGVVGPSTPRLAGETVVVDLSSLWAGPLCADLLGRAGCRVIKVESSSRPDGARQGHADFYDLLHAGHESVALDFREPSEVAVLRQLMTRADVIIEGSRPRALAALGVDRSVLEGPSVWVSITGHGRTGSGSDRIAFGDDAAVAGGLVGADEIGPVFCCDAVADPLSGLFAAAATLDALVHGGRWYVDVAMSAVAASVARGPAVAMLPVDDISAPQAREVLGRAAQLGADTESVLRDLAVRR
jgi:hypothetical protein